MRPWMQCLWAQLESEDLSKYTLIWNVCTGGKFRFSVKNFLKFFGGNFRTHNPNNNYIADITKCPNLHTTFSTLCDKPILNYNCTQHSSVIHKFHDSNNVNFCIGHINHKVEFFVCTFIINCKDWYFASIMPSKIQPVTNN